MDEERENQFFELKEKHEEARYLLQAVAQQAQMATTRQKRTHVMSQELEVLPENTLMYKNIGKAYFLATKPAILQELADVSAMADEELATLASKEAHAKKVLKETEVEIKELMAVAVNKAT